MMTLADVLKQFAPTMRRINAETEKRECERREAIDKFMSEGVTIRVRLPKKKS